LFAEKLNNNKKLMSFGFRSCPSTKTPRLQKLLLCATPVQCISRIP